MRGIAPLLLIAASLLAVIPSRAEFVHDKIRSMDGFHYLAKFCYDYTAPASATQGPDQYENTMTLSVFFKAETDQVPKDLRLYVYDDQANSWPAVYGKNIPCEQKVAKARNSTAVTFDAATNTWQMPLARIHEHVRPRFWYIVAANCKGFKDLEYEIRFTNKGKSSWDREFGVNEQGLNTLYLVYFLVYTVGVLIHMYALQSVMCSKKMHPIVKLLTATILLQYLSVFLGLVHYGVFVSNGSGVPVLKGFSEAAQVFAKLCFMLLLIFVAQGWTISTDRLTTKTQIYLVLIVFVVAYLALLIWDVTGRDPASTLYVYESVPGVSIVCLDIFTGLWFIWSIKDTYSEESDTDKKSFYMYIGFGYALWFLTLPIIVTIAAYLHPWAREIIVTSISLTATTIAYFALMILLWPSRAEGYFRISGPDVAADHDDDDL